MNMNISTGGPHILFFERDSSLMALLISEFQLAGYECHTARTAVEVFDAIARHSIRAVLVNLAQAAAGRREFWVALDAQRRGRGVQVFTYRCYNLASYGPREADERSQSTPTDMEIDGMLGLMNLVERMRERIPVVSATSSSISAFSRNDFPSAPAYSSQLDESRTAPRSAVSTLNTQQGNSDYGATRPVAAVHLATQASPLSSTNSNQQSYSEKIRAVLYSPQRAPGSPNSETTHIAPQVPQAPVAPSGASEATALQQLAYGRLERDSRESGLAQLSRLVQGYHPSAGDSSDNTRMQQNEPLIATPVLRASPIEGLPVDHISASVTIDEPRRRGDMGTRAPYGTNGNGQNGYASQHEIASTTPLASMTSALPVIPTTPPVHPSTAPTSPLAEHADSVNPTIPIAAVPVAQSVSSTGVGERRQERQIIERSKEELLEDVMEAPSEADEAQVLPVRSQTRVAEPQKQSTSVSVQESKDEAPASQRLPSSTTYVVPQTNMDVEAYEELNVRPTEDSPVSKNQQEVALADIIQSFPASLPSSPASVQPPVFNGRTMRSLGTVLLEGHLVPQSRLEVAQNIQRMLRGVDLRYELGEILLMFKLLTPDQLLAATLMSYGLITAQQISALGRIRQELHSIGLEYDLESLLILFRMLTPEQLREARTSWQS